MLYWPYAELDRRRRRFSSKKAARIAISDFRADWVAKFGISLIQRSNIPKLRPRSRVVLPYRYEWGTARISRVLKSASTKHSAFLQGKSIGIAWRNAGPTLEQLVRRSNLLRDESVAEHCIMNTVNI